MTTQRIAPRAPAPNAHEPVGQRKLRNAVAIAGIAAFIATGASSASAANSPDSVTPASASTVVVWRAQQLREYRETIIALYHRRPAQARPIKPGTTTSRELRSSVAGQYGQARGRRTVA